MASAWELVAIKEGRKSALAERKNWSGGRKGAEPGLRDLSPKG